MRNIVKDMGEVVRSEFKLAASKLRNINIPTDSKPQRIFAMAGAAICACAGACVFSHLHLHDCFREPAYLIGEGMLTWFGAMYGGLSATKDEFNLSINKDPQANMRVALRTVAGALTGFSVPVTVFPTLAYAIFADIYADSRRYIKKMRAKPASLTL